MGHVNVHTDCHLISCYTSLCPSRLRVSLHRVAASEAPQECVGIVATLQPPQHATRRTTHTHANISNMHTNRATHHKNKTCTSRSMEEGFDGRCAWRPCPECQIDMPPQATGSVLPAQPQPKTCQPEKTEERGRAGGRAALDCVTVTFRYAHAKR